MALARRRQAGLARPNRVANGSACGAWADAIRTAFPGAARQLDGRGPVGIYRPHRMHTMCTLSRSRLPARKARIVLHVMSSGTGRHPHTPNPVCGTKPATLNSAHLFESGPVQSGRIRADSGGHIAVRRRPAGPRQTYPRREGLVGGDLRPTERELCANCIRLRLEPELREEGSRAPQVGLRLAGVAGSA